MRHEMLLLRDRANCQRVTERNQRQNVQDLEGHLMREFSKALSELCPK